MRKNNIINWLCVPATLAVFSICFPFQQKELGKCNLSQISVNQEKNQVIKNVSFINNEINKNEGAIIFTKAIDRKIVKNKKVENNKEGKKRKKPKTTKPYIIESTAYIETGNPCKDGTMPVEGETLAGKQEWLGKSCKLYYVAEDGSIGELIGTYKFHDTGFGNDPDGDGIGTIQTGERIDIYMESYERAINWGVRKVYIEFLD